jgi:hypothetical protein
MSAPYPRDWREPLDHSRPMAAARIVRRERYAWPGGYALMLATTDGGALCPACVAAEWHQIAEENRWTHGAGWKPAGIICEAETDGTLYCDHCNAETINPQEHDA